MKRFFLLNLCFLLVALLAFSSSSKAQIFGASTDADQNKTSSSEQNNNWLANPRRNTLQKQDANEIGPQKRPVATTTTPTKTPNATNKDSKQPDYYVPQPKRPTLDGVERGHTSMKPVISNDKQDKVDKFIFVYYSNFEMRTTMSGKILCDVRLIVLSTLDRKINNISVRLKWPKMETPISFSDVSPNIETYIDYTLVGDGCYSMDSAPNIVVNRCRVRDMSQKECAEKIRWLRKSR